MKQVFIHQKDDGTYQVQLIVTKTQSITTTGKTITEALLKARTDLLGKVVEWDRLKGVYARRVTAGRLLRRRLTSYVLEEIGNAKE